MPSRNTRLRPSQSDALHAQGPTPTEATGRVQPDHDKPGPVGNILVLAQREKAEVERRAAAFFQELKPSGEVGQVLVRLAATMSVRMERCVSLENASMAERVRQAILEFVPPEGIDAAEASRLRAEAATRVLFDKSKEGGQARRYESAAQRSFFRALQELRRIEKAVKAAEAESEAEMSRELLASFSSMSHEEKHFDAMFAASIRPEVRSTPLLPPTDDFSRLGGRPGIPLTVGRRR